MAETFTTLTAGAEPAPQSGAIRGQGDAATAESAPALP